jgi:hypothetical protein
VKNSDHIEATENCLVVTRILMNQYYVLITSKHYTLYMYKNYVHFRRIKKDKKLFSGAGTPHVHFH